LAQLRLIHATMGRHQIHWTSTSSVDRISIHLNPAIGFAHLVVAQVTRWRGACRVVFAPFDAQAPTKVIIDPDGLLVLTQMRSGRSRESACGCQEICDHRLQ
jgi:hypothetical protein